MHGNSEDTTNFLGINPAVCKYLKDNITKTRQWSTRGRSTSDFRLPKQRGEAQNKFLKNIETYNKFCSNFIQRKKPQPRALFCEKIGKKYKAELKPDHKFYRNRVLLNSDITHYTQFPEFSFSNRLADWIEKQYTTYTHKRTERQRQQEEKAALNTKTTKTTQKKRKAPPAPKKKQEETYESFRKGGKTNFSKILDQQRNRMKK